MDLANVSHWLKENKLFLNLKKTECLLFGTRQRLKISGAAEDFSVTVDGTLIKFSTVFKYLGVMLDNNLTFNEHIINYVVAKVSQKLRILSTTKFANRLYKSMILPLLDYSDITWYGCGLENKKEDRSFAKKSWPHCPKKLSGIDKWCHHQATRMEAAFRETTGTH